MLYQWTHSRVIQKFRRHPEPKSRQGVGHWFGQISVQSVWCQPACRDGGNERSVEGDRAEAGTRQRTRIRTGDFLAVATNGSHSRNAAPGRFAEPRAGASAGGKQNEATERARDRARRGRVRRRANTHARPDRSEWALVPSISPPRKSIFAGSFGRELSRCAAWF